MKNYRIYLVRFIRYLKTHTKLLGFMEIESNTLSQKELFDISTYAYEVLKNEPSDFWGEVFKRNRQTFLIDKLVLRSAKNKSFAWLLRYIVISILRALHSSGDVLKVLAKTPKKYHISLNVTGDQGSKRKIIVWTNNTLRSKVFNRESHYLQYDLIVGCSEIDNYELMSSTELNFKAKLKCLKLKLRFPFIQSDVILEAIASNILFTKAFDELTCIGEDVGVFLREGVTPLSKMFLYTAGKLGLTRNVIYTMPVLTENLLVPRECDILVIISDSLPSYTYGATQTIVLGDNPYLPWRDIANSVPAAPTIGLMLGDCHNRWVQQEATDRAILDALATSGCSLCLGRPHPQELTRPDRLAYYSSLLKEYPFLKIENAKIETFLTDISLLIVYTTSSLVQESILCNRPVIEYRPDHDHSPNKAVINLSGGLGVSISDIRLLTQELNNKFSEGTVQRKINWERCINNLKLSATLQPDITKIFNRHSIKPRHLIDSSSV
ncbi:hypothetical protein [Reinekea forsetii]|uniref:Uncharacterized protein n=1 Tax=Reinekea forsetii TaxID=1336806 RepID=A0A2K8KRA4_9GAMM|nr:hypothetical protein [Reinekea forsetii]ATX76609.1 hypothetical protein REIFOR_01463 [Reinekea forsetii]